MIFIGHPGQGPTILIVPIRPPSGELEAIDPTSVRVYVSLAGEIIICLDVTLRTGVGTTFAGVFGELDELGQVGQMEALAGVSTGLSAILMSGAGLDSSLRISDPLEEQAVSGGFQGSARIVEISTLVKIGEFDDVAQAIELSLIARGGGDLEMASAICE